MANPASVGLCSLTVQPSEVMSRLLLPLLQTLEPVRPVLPSRMAQHHSITIAVACYRFMFDKHVRMNTFDVQAPKHSEPRTASEGLEIC